MTPEEVKAIIPDPKFIVKSLNQTIIGQEQAKRSLALLALNRSLLMLHKKGLLYLHTPIEKSNILMMGPTGVGKTALIKEFGKILDLPIPVFDVTSITAAGYIGAKVEDILEQLVNEIYNHRYTSVIDPLSLTYSEADTLIYMIENGIVYLDEIDKVCSRHANGADVNGDMVQNELLKVLEAGECFFGSSRRQSSHVHGVSSVRTDNIYFICGGAFQGLTGLVSHRLADQGGIGFSSNLDFKSLENEDSTKLLEYVNTEDLIQYGFKPEFLGRLPIRTSLHSATKEFLKQIMLVPRNSILEQYKAMFEVFGVYLKFSDKAIDQMAEEALKLNLGARSLKQIVYTVLEPILFDLWSIEPDLELTVTIKDVEKVFK